eukprot:TRINITY_DN1477_c0_g1_i1.p1 TRINITY_DN1477_c0_g1~~TRINITY_DN1477_c0_g1_i1.p1  ORF type:complete len:277 (-),score=56.24 TRINITY_DN1477_c0_g1_i1:27-857(-)
MADSKQKGRYQDKVTIVTGGSKGIGEGCVREFVKAGSKVAFCSRNEKEGKTLEKELNSHGPGEAFYVRADVSREEDLKHFVDETIKKYGKIDCLINNAGVHPHSATIDDFSVDDLKNLFQINFVSYFIMCKLCLPQLRKTKGNIINMSSFVGTFGQPGATTYVATKGAITAFTKALALDEAKYGVRVNSVSPGNIWTPMWNDYASGEPDKQKAIEAGNAAQILNRMGTLEESGLLCLFIAAEATFTTGVDHILSGGAELGYGIKSSGVVGQTTSKN